MNSLSSQFIVILFLNSDDFAKYLASGELTAKKNLKFESSDYKDIQAITKKICSHFQVSSKRIFLFKILTMLKLFPIILTMLQLLKL